MAFVNIRDNAGNDFMVKISRGKLTVEKLEPHQDEKVPVGVTIYELNLSPGALRL